ncbi:probable cytochrome P450 6a13 [Halyomorpha halys]|uniref:probable cytochrome P450 6a13 n=1 Tax=Halyomorpha halys TaxID=286706 RepID=UPI0006D4EBC1|nr:probable cytochrome P450 6a13 [Halyomorpha halys]
MVFFFPGSYFLIITAVLLYLFYRYATSTYSFWADRNVPFLKPVPFFGNLWYRIIRKTTMIDDQQMQYNFFGEDRYGGTYLFRKPNLLIKDPQLVEQILIKDFSTFYNRSLNPDPKISPLNKNLLTLQDSQWKNLRSKLTPAFSSGKLKVIHQEMILCCDELTKHLSSYAETGEPLDTKKTLSRFIVYAIGSIAFGLKLDTLNDPNCEFGKVAENVFKTTFLKALLGFLRMGFPSLGRVVDAVGRLFGKDGSDNEAKVFIMNVVKDTVEYREKNNIQRNDFLQIMMEMRKQDANSDDEMKFDLELMGANAFVFLLAGYDTAAGTMSFMLYELAAHQEIQERLLQEIVEVLKKHAGVLTYEAVKEMKYLDQVLSETLRLFPPIPSTFRVSRSPYQIPGSSLLLPAGSTVTVPIYSLQHDPKHFPDPEKFNPDRFAEDSKIVKGAYLPFGDGPRICIAQRFAKLEIKLAVIKMLLEYKFTVNEKTKTPFTFDRAFFLNPTGGIWLNLSRRT